MHEEVGLQFEGEELESVDKIGLWEVSADAKCLLCDKNSSTLSDTNKFFLLQSSFPTKLSLGLPKRHHIVCYLHAKLKSHVTSDVLRSRLKLDPSEVGASAWVDVELAQAIVAADEEAQILNKSNPTLPKLEYGFRVHVLFLTLSNYFC